MGKKSRSGSGINSPDHIPERLKNNFLSKIYLNSFIRIRNLFDHGYRIRDGKIRIRDKHPGSATL
jgi:hypothetical protein